MTIISASRYHDISCGHRVVGHENKCQFLHGHNYRVHFEVHGKLDGVGRVLDFSVIKELLCSWLEEHWDHRLLLWDSDPILGSLLSIEPPRVGRTLSDSIVIVPFNPTAENMAEYLLRSVGPLKLLDTGVRLVRVRVEETRKCSASAEEE